MKKVIKITLIAIICFMVLFWITIETNPEIATRLGYASGPGKPDEIAKTTLTEQEAIVGGDLIPMVFIDGKLYLETGKSKGELLTSDVIDGKIISEVDSGELPAQNDQSNFGTGYYYRYGEEGTVEVVINGTWWIFEAEQNK